MLKKCPLSETSVTKKALFFFILQALTDQSFTFNSQFLCKLEAYISKTMCGIFHFRLCLVFIKVYIFVQ